MTRIINDFLLCAVLVLNPVHALGNLIQAAILYIGDYRPILSKKKPRIRPVERIIISHISKRGFELGLAHSEVHVFNHFASDSCPFGALSLF